MCSCGQYDHLCGLIKCIVVDGTAERVLPSAAVAAMRFGWVELELVGLFSFSNACRKIFGQHASLNYFAITGKV